MCRCYYLLLAVCVVAGLSCGLPAIAAAKASDEEVRCVRLDNRIADLRLKLRLGYSAKQGRLYRQKLTALEAERKALCR